MVVEKQGNGDLVMQCEDLRERRTLLENYEDWLNRGVSVEASFVSEFLESEGYEPVQAEEVGALTSATLIAKDGEVWGDMNYQVRSCVQELILGEAVRWTRG